MQEIFYELLFVLASLGLLLYDVFQRERRTQETKLAGALAIGIFALFVQNANILLLLPGVVIFYFMGRFYGKMKDVPVVLLAFAYVLIAWYYAAPQLIAQVALFGLLASSEIGMQTNKDRSNSKKEVRRDFVQIGFGILVLAAFFFLPMRNAEISILVFVVLGWMVANYVILYRKARFSKMLAGMERKNTILGEGAIMLGIGTLLIISVINFTPLIVIALGALYIGDAVATIVGVNFGKEKLFYNKNKSVLGAAACFAVVALIAFPFIGMEGLLVALIAAIAESIPTPIDDNLFVSIILAFVLLMI